MTTNTTFTKGTVFCLAQQIDYSEGGIVSKQILKNQAGNITLFSFDKEQGLSEHTASFDAMVQILDGKAEITIGGTSHTMETGQMIIMPADIPHAVYAVEQFKMLLTMVRNG